MGDIGTNVGAFAGFPPGIVAGTIHVTDPVSVQAATDVEFAYSSFAPISCDLVIGTTLGNNQVLSPAVYCLGAASSLNGDLILDGQCDPNALFILKIDGALSTTSFSNVILTNSASACNIYWQINGAVALGESSTFKGTIVANGAISFLEGASLEGRALSRSGAVNMHNNTVDLNSQPMASILSVNGPTEFCEGGSVMISGNCGGMWNTGETTPTLTVTTSGDYYVTNSNDCGNAVSIHVIITVSPAPVCAIAGASTICAGQSTQLCVPPGAASYLWSTGATTNCITVSTAATYAVTVTGANGCSSICSQAVSLSPAPVCAIAGASTICAGQSTQLCVLAGAASYLWSTGATTNCITVSTAATYAVTVIGANGCSSICSQAVSLSPAPVCLITGADIPCLGQSSELCVPAGADGYMWSTGATTNCITVFVAGTYSVTVTNAGNCTNICGITISVNQDNIPPAIICPMDLTLECDLSTQPPNTGTATATDACDLAPVLDFTDLINPENCPQSYSIARVWTATDGAGNNSVCVQTITVADNTPPVIICPANLSLNCNSSTLPSDTGTATATDNCSFAPQVNSNDVTTPGNCPQAFTITRTWTAIDACGNSSNCTQTILVADATPPTITCPANVTVQCASLVPIANTALVTATDNCGGTTTISHLGDAITNQVCANNYTLTRTYQAADACGNTANCAQVVTVFDATIPTITCPANVSVQCAGLVPIANTALVTAID
ncbi:MAG: DUF3494 domain-containing protein, partial [Saprospiraceae bacterium]|nr:DUF3494 domain-containing protein [Saprospiraceae bacterium]